MGVAAAITAMPVQAKGPLNAQEQAHIEFVKDYLHALTIKPLDMEGIVKKYFAPNAMVRWLDEMPVAMGAEAAIAAVKPLVSPGTWLEVQLFDVFARGPLVVTSRVDIIKVPGKPDDPIPLAGLHIVRDGKFIEYVDYLAR
jgi:limonene-1,2-epoxide hydrolase